MITTVEEPHTIWPSDLNLKFSDRSLLLALEAFKVAGYKEISNGLTDGRKIVWWLQSLKVLSENKAPNADRVNKIYEALNGLLSAQILVWAPISLLDKYGRETLGTVGELLKTGHAFSSIGFNELDFLVKAIRLTIEGKKDFRSLEFISRSCLVARAASSYFGYSSLASLFGIVGGGIGLWTAYKEMKN